MVHGNEILWNDSKEGFCIKIRVKFIISFVISLLFQMNMLKLLLKKKKEMYVIFDDRGGKKSTHWSLKFCYFGLFISD